MNNFELFTLNKLAMQKLGIYEAKVIKQYGKIENYQVLYKNIKSIKQNANT